MRYLLDLLGLFAALLGLLTSFADRSERIRPFQILLNEIPWVTSSLAALVTLVALLRRPKSWLAAILGAVGLGMTTRPFWVWRATVADMESALRAGLGDKYQDSLPAAARARWASHRSALKALFQRQAIQAGLTRDIEFSAPDGHALKLDVYQPVISPALGVRYPAVIVLHPGGWRNGDKFEWFAPLCRYTASLGYVVFDIQYRLAQVARWPAQLEDVKAAIRWVRAHADQYNLDPAQIVLLGRSAGAHLALMAGYHPDPDTKVRAVVSLYAPTELRWHGLSADSPIVELMGGTYEQLPYAYDSATPIYFVRDGLPPTLLIEAGMDSLVTHTHGDRLAARLSMTDTPFALLRVPWSRHGFDAVWFGRGARLIQYYVDRFLAWSVYARQ